MNMQSPGSTAAILRRGAPNSTAIAEQWYQQVRPGIVDSMKICWASVGPIVLMGRLLARVKSVSVFVSRRDPHCRFTKCIRTQQVYKV